MKEVKEAHSLRFGSTDTLLLAGTLNFFSRFFFSFLCLRPTTASGFVFSPLRIRRCLGSNFLAASTLSYSRQKPVLVPPPYFAFIPKMEMHCASFFLNWVHQLFELLLGRHWHAW